MDVRDILPLDVRPHREEQRSVGVDVVAAPLGIILRDKDGHFFPPR